MSLLTKVKNYANGVRILTDFLGSNGDVVGKELAERRAAVCSLCPLNKQGLAIAEAVSEVIREQTEVKNFLELRTSQDENLHTCSVCDCPLPLKVWQVYRRVKPSEDEMEKFPTYCWLRKEA
jgi:hypothetical protein